MKRYDNQLIYIVKNLSVDALPELLQIVNVGHYYSEKYDMSSRFSHMRLQLENLIELDG